MYVLFVLSVSAFCIVFLVVLFILYTLSKLRILGDRIDDISAFTGYDEFSAGGPGLRQDICNNCGSSMPDGCGGKFKDDGDGCRLNQETTGATTSINADDPNLSDLVSRSESKPNQENTPEIRPYIGDSKLETPKNCENYMPGPKHGYCKRCGHPLNEHRYKPPRESHAYSGGVNLLFAANDYTPDLVFVEAVNDQGQSIQIGEWSTNEHGFHVLRIALNE